MAETGSFCRNFSLGILAESAETFQEFISSVVLKETYFRRPLHNSDRDSVNHLANLPLEALIAANESSGEEEERVC